MRFKLIIFYFAYLAAGLIGLNVGAEGLFATPVWYPSGIAVAFLILCGYRLAPIVMLAAFSVNFIHGASFVSALCIGFGNMAEAFLAAFFISRHRGFNLHLKTARDVLILAVYGGILCTAVSAAIGAVTLWQAHVIESQNLWLIFKTWWQGDITGVLMMAPLILVWSERPWGKIIGAHLIEMIGFALLVALVTAVMFSEKFLYVPVALRLPYLFYPLFIWMALRFETRGVSLIIFVSSIFVLWITLMGHGPFYSTNRVIAAANVQFFFGVAAIVTLIMATVVQSRRLMFLQVEDLNQKQKVVEESLREKTASLEKMTHVQNEFVTMITHELRTPMASIKEGLSIVLDGVDGPINAEQTTTLNLVKRNVDRLSRLVTNVLDFQRLESGIGHLKFSKQKINALLDEVVATLRVNAEHHGVILKLENERDVTATCDPDRIKQVLINLIDNAIKFTPRAGTVTVKQNVHGKMVRLAVADTGIGIAKEDQARVFEMFGQAEGNESVKTGGFGVGLAVCQRIVLAHHGKIWLESKPNEGCCFFVEIPI